MGCLRRMLEKFAGWRWWSRRSHLGFYDDGSSLTTTPESAMLDSMSYPGGKNGAGVYQKIINLMPPHDRYFEPLGGRGNP